MNVILIAATDGVVVSADTFSSGFVFSVKISHQSAAAPSVGVPQLSHQILG